MPPTPIQPKDLSFVVRPFRPSDEDLVQKSWQENYKTSAFGKQIPPMLYTAGMRQRIDVLLSQPTTTTLVACDPNHTDVIYGWSVASGDVLHYVHVKPHFRRQGVATALLAPLPDVFQYTHLSADAWVLWASRGHPRLKQCIYNPFSLNH